MCLECCFAANGTAYLFCGIRTVIVGQVVLLEVWWTSPCARTRVVFVQMNLCVYVQLSFRRVPFPGACVIRFPLRRAQDPSAFKTIVIPVMGMQDAEESWKTRVHAYFAKVGRFIASPRPGKKDKTRLQEKFCRACFPWTVAMASAPFRPGKIHSEATKNGPKPRKYRWMHG